MSQVINCPNCGSENSVGSKYCNHCGSKLPPSTHIICPNCEAVNPINRVFCDNCGTRLVSDGAIQEEDEPSEPAPPATKAFDLPARRPGDTGEIDPKTLPDWLLTGQADPSEEGAEPEEADAEEASPEWSDEQATVDSDQLPRVEDLTPEKRMTDDLPDWLVNDSDSDPIIASPEGISTEMFLDLMSRADEPGEGGESGEEAETPESLQSSGADLPDWLSEAGGLEMRDEDDVADEDEASEAFDVPLWLDEDEEETAVDADEAGKDVDPSEISVTAWLSEPDEDETETAESESGDTDWFADLDDESAAAPAAESATTDDEEDSEISEWLQELGQLAGGDEEEPPADTTQAEAPSESDEYNWLAELRQTPPSDTAEEEEDEWGDNWLETYEESEDDDWLASLRSEVSAEKEAETPAEETPAAPEEPPDDKDLADEIMRTLSFEEKDDVATDFVDLFQVDESELDNLPDWLSDVAATGGSLVADEEAEGPPSVLDDLFSKEEMAAKSELDWLMQTGGLRLPDDAEEQAEEELPPELAQSSPSDGTGELDWLAELASLDTNTLRSEEEEAAAQAAEEAASEEDVSGVEAKGVAPVEMDLADEAASETAVSETGDGEASEEDEIEEAAEEAPTATDEWRGTDAFLASESPIQEELPDWLSDLGPPPGERTAEESRVPSQELPDWLADLKPDETIGDIDSSLPSALGKDEDDDALGGLEGIPEELAGSELPGWLDNNNGDVDLPAATFEVEEEIEHSDIPDWLQQEGKEADDAAAGDEDVHLDDSDELEAILDEVPPAEEQEEALAQADIPDWVRDLKPSELSEGAPPLEMPPEVAQPVQKEGPLAGLQGVVEVSPAIVQSPQQIDLTPFTVTAEQEQQAALLRQLTQSVAERKQAADVGRARAGAGPWTRIVLALLLLAAIVVGLLLPNLPIGFSAPTVGGVEEAYAAVEAAAGQPVLVAFEYTPAVSGELSPTAALLMAQLAANESPILTVSQYAAGVPLAEEARGDAPGGLLGYLPGEAVGLRTLGTCLAQGRTTCATLSGWEANSDLLADVALVVVLTGERNSLVHWVEQVESQVDVPLVMAVPQSLAPVAGPYQASGQIDGVIGGAPATAVYQQIAGDSVDDALQQRLTAQTMGQLAAVLILLLGLIIYGLFSTAASATDRIE